MKEKERWYKSTWFTILMLIFAFPVGLFLMWRFSGWNKGLKWAITAVLIFLALSSIYFEEPSETKNETKSVSKQTSKKEESKEKPKEKAKPEDNTVYGKLTKKHSNNSVAVVDDMTYVLGDNDKILQAEKEFPDLPLDKNIDKNFLNQHAKDLMAKDAEFVSNKTDTEQKYHSKSLSKDYYVTFSLNEDGKVQRLIVSSFE